MNDVDKFYMKKKNEEVGSPDIESCVDSAFNRFNTV